MDLKRSDLEKIAHLARIKVQDHEYDALGQRLTQILNWVGQLEEVDTSNVEPMFMVDLECMPMRNDIVTDGGYAETILQNAPEAEFNMFAAPKVIE